MPCCARRVVSVAPIIAKAKPDEMPRNRAASGAGSKYGRMPSGRRACQLAEVVVIVDRQGRMIGEAARLVDRLLHGLGRYGRRGDLVVDAPADILLPGLSPVRPPGVLVRLGVQEPEDVDIAKLVEHLREPRALLRQEAGVLLVALPIPEVDLLVGDVPVAAQDEVVAALLQLAQMDEELLQEAEFGGLAMRAGRARREVHGDHPQLAEARLDIAPFGVEFPAGEAARDLVGRRAAEERDAAVALLLRE